MGPEPSGIKSPNAHLQGRGKKRYLGILDGLILSTTYGYCAQNMHLKAVFSLITDLSRDEQFSLIFSRAP